MRIILAVVTLLALGVLSVQVVLSTDIPRRLVLSALNEETGLRFSATSLRTGWRGRTELRDLTISLPLERDPFATVPVMRIRHTDLVRLAFFRNVEIAEAQLDDPHILLRQDESGAWNIARAAAIIEQVQAARDPSKPRGAIHLPELRVSSARLEIIRPARTITYDDINIVAGTDSTSATDRWRLEALQDGRSLLHGELSPQGLWPHRAEISVEHAAPLVEPWREELMTELQELPEVPENLGLAITWQGELTTAGDGVRGRLVLGRFTAGPLHAGGAADIVVAGHDVTIEPADLVVDTGDEVLGTAHLRSGKIEIDAQHRRVRLVRLLVDALDASAQVDGWWDGARESGHAQARWAGAVDHWLLRHEGVATVDFSVPSVGRRMAQCTILTQGRIPQGYWDGEIVFTGFGNSWQDLAGRIRAERLKFLTADADFDFSGAAARFARQDEQVALTHLLLPSGASPSRAAGHPTRGQALIHLASRAWSVDLSAANWTPPARLPQWNGSDHSAIDVHLHAFGDDAQAELTNFMIRGGGDVVYLHGTYAAQETSPLNVTATVDVSVPDPSETLQGRLRAEMSVTGNVEPMQLILAGRAEVHEPMWEGRTAQSVVMNLRGRVDERQAEFASDAFSLFGGSWQVTGDVDRSSRDARLEFIGEDVHVEQIAAFATDPDDLAHLGLQGIASAQVVAKVPAFDFSQLSVTGTWTVRDLLTNLVQVSSGNGGVHVTGDHVQLREMYLEHRGGELHGSADLRLSDLRNVTTEWTISRWPLEVVPLGAETHVSGHAELTLDLPSYAAAGTVTLDGRALLNDEEVAMYELDASLDGRVVELRHVRAEGLNGWGSGSGRLHLDAEHWTKSTAAFEWQDVDLGQLARHWNRAGMLEGISAGTISLHRSEDPRAHEPMRLEITANLEDTTYGSVSVQAASLVGHLGPDRLMIEEARLGMAGGQLSMWGRLTRHGGEPFAHLFLDVDDVQIQELVDLFQDADRRLQGRVRGWLAGGGYLREPHRLFGQGQMLLEESDIAAVPGIATLYDVLRISFINPQPTGRGAATIRMEGNAVEISRLTYFNRGTDIVARLRIEDVWKGGESPISGLAAGVVRPLRDLDLPLVGRMDRLISAIQTDTASVEVGGTLAEHQTRVVPFGEVTSALSRILRGRVD